MPCDNGYGNMGYGAVEGQTGWYAGSYVEGAPAGCSNCASGPYAEGDMMPMDSVSPTGNIDPGPKRDN